MPTFSTPVAFWTPPPFFSSLLSLPIIGCPSSRFPLSACPSSPSLIPPVMESEVDAALTALDVAPGPKRTDQHTTLWPPEALHTLLFALMHDPERGGRREGGSHRHHFLSQLP